MSRRETFQNAQNWVREYKENNAATSTHNVVLIGNKIDLQDRTVTREEGESLATRLGGSYIEASSKTGSNVPASFESLAKSIISSLGSDLQVSKDLSKFKVKGVALQAEQPQQEVKKGCCG